MPGFLVHVELCCFVWPSSFSEPQSPPVYSRAPTPTSWLWEGHRCQVAHLSWGYHHQTSSNLPTLSGTLHI